MERSVQVSHPIRSSLPGTFRYEVAGRFFILFRHLGVESGWRV